MFRVLNTVSRHFSIVPERASKFFNLTLQTTLQRPISQTMKKDVQMHIKEHEKNGSLLMGFEVVGLQNKSAKFEYFFQSPNQVEAFQFLKKGPLAKYIQNYQIIQIEMESRTRQKELAPQYLRS